MLLSLEELKMGLLETDAILLKYVDSGEADRVLVFFTRDYGKVTLIAKSARKSIKSQFLTIDLLSSQVILYKDKARGLKILSSVTMLETFFNLRSDIKVLATAIYFADLIDNFYHENEKNEVMYDILRSFLVRFEAGVFKASDIPVFELKLLALAGLAPNMSNCLDCGRALEAGSVKKPRFSVPMGGCLCDSCGSATARDFTRSISLGTLKLLNLAKETPVENISRINFTKNSLKDAGMLGDFIRYHLNKSLTSRSYLRKLGLV